MRSDTFQTRLRILGGSRWFADVPADALDTLALVKERQAAPDEAIFLQTDEGSALFAILAGQVRIVIRGADGREQVLRVLGPGEMFGEIAALDGRPRSADAIAVTRCRLLLLERRSLLALIASQPAVAIGLITVLCERLRDTSADRGIAIPHAFGTAGVRLAGPAQRQYVRVDQRDADGAGSSDRGDAGVGEQEAARLASREGDAAFIVRNPVMAQRIGLFIKTLIASAYFSATNTRRVRRALKAVFAGAVGKDEVSHVWRKVKGAWNSRSLAAEPIIRFILDGTIVRVRTRQEIDVDLASSRARRQTGWPEGATRGKNMGGESEAAWRALLDDLVKRGRRSSCSSMAGLVSRRRFRRSGPSFRRNAARCISINLLARAPERLHEEISNDYKDMIYADLAGHPVPPLTVWHGCGRPPSRPACRDWPRPREPCYNEFGTLPNWMRRHAKPDIRTGRDRVRQDEYVSDPPSHPGRQPLVCRRAGGCIRHLGLSHEGAAGSAR